LGTSARTALFGSAEAWRLSTSVVVTGQVVSMVNAVVTLETPGADAPPGTPTTSTSVPASWTLAHVKPPCAYDGSVTVTRGAFWASR